MASIADALAGGSGPVADELAVTAELLRRSTVHVRVGRHGAGSGVIWRPDGLIITNAHVARGTDAQVELSDGRTFEATVTARDAERDLASLKVEALDLPSAPIADSDSLRVGQLVAAVGNPLGLSGALTLGIIHSISPASGGGRGEWVQADVRLAPGNSGGPLADVTGQVIGINSMIAGGLGLAVPSNAVQRFLQNQGGRPRLGVTTQPVWISAEQPGLLVLDVVSGSPADTAGVIIGDVLVATGDRALHDPRQLLDALFRAGPGGRVSIELMRGGERRQLLITLAAAGSTPHEEAA